MCRLNPCATFWRFPCCSSRCCRRCGISIVCGCACQLSADLSFYQSLVSSRRFRQGHKFSFVLLPEGRTDIPPLVVYLCAPCKQGEYVTSAFQFRYPRHSVPPSLSFSALGRVDCGEVVSRLSDLILDIIC